MTKADWARRRKEAKERDGHRCQMCATNHDLTVHHIQPRSIGGSNELYNLITLCNGCHKDTHGAYRIGLAHPNTFWAYLRAMRLNNDLPEELDHGDI